MPHYKDGTPAKIGDTVKGKGYNLRITDGELRELVGTVVDVRPGTETCNLTVFVPEIIDLGENFQWPNTQIFALREGLHTVLRADGHTVAVKCLIEFGQTDAFEKIA